MLSVNITDKVARKNIRRLKKSRPVKTYVFTSSGNSSPVKIELRVVSAKEQENNRNPAYKYFSID